jgi:tRNA (cmo5U34)-methyltransferase
VNVKDVFDATARTYDRARRQLVPCFDDFYRTALELVPFGPDAAFTALDLGAGTGLLSSFVAGAFPRAEITLVDISEEMLAQARERLAAEAARVRFIIMDFATSIPAGGYDLVISALAIHHLGDAEKRGLFRNICGVLRPGGAFINADQVLGPSATAERRYHETWLRQARERDVGATDLAQALERMRADRMCPLAVQLRWLEEVGFRDVDCAYKNYRFAVYSGFK